MLMFRGTCIHHFLPCNWRQHILAICLLHDTVIFQGTVISIFAAIQISARPLTFYRSDILVYSVVQFLFNLLVYCLLNPTNLLQPEQYSIDMLTAGQCFLFLMKRRWLPIHPFKVKNRGLWVLGCFLH